MADIICEFPGLPRVMIKVEMCLKEMLIHFFQTQIGANKDAFGVGTNLPAQRNRIRGFLFVEV